MARAGGRARWTKGGIGECAVSELMTYSISLALEDDDIMPHTYEE